MKFIFIPHCRRFMFQSMCIRIRGNLGLKVYNLLIFCYVQRATRSERFKEKVMEIIVTVMTDALTAGNFYNNLN